MRRIIRTTYKALSYGWVLAISWIATIILRIILWVNEVTVGPGVRAHRGVPSIQVNRHSGAVTIGTNVTFNSYGAHSWNSRCKVIVRENATLTIGDNTGMNGVMLYCAERITIGRRVLIGGGTRVYDTDFHPITAAMRSDPATCHSVVTKPITIEDDVFIGANCMIGKGVTIGRGSVIAAGAVVVKSIPAGVIAGGNPCKVIKPLP